MSKKPNNRQKIMARALYEGKTEVEAYRLAGYAIPRTENALRVRAHAVAHNSNVLVMLNTLHAMADRGTVASVDERKEILSEIARGKITNYVKNNRICVDPEDLNSGAVAEVTTSEVKYGKGDDAPIAEITKLKLHNPVSAITELNKMERIGSYDTEVNINIVLQKIVTKLEVNDMDYSVLSRDELKLLAYGEESEGE